MTELLVSAMIVTRKIRRGDTITYDTGTRQLKISRRSLARRIADALRRRTA